LRKECLSGNKASTKRMQRRTKPSQLLGIVREYGKESPSAAAKCNVPAAPAASDKYAVSYSKGFICLASKMNREGADIDKTRVSTRSSAH
jgi:hypothetical protein